ncbi:hypothetical protein F5B17DRAFT_425599 [Nemania serpens]|nr:hypothetical protein F5B17DRAFT_425599 [Nemania serpens]
MSPSGIEHIAKERRRIRKERKTARAQLLVLQGSIETAHRSIEAAQEALAKTQSDILAQIAKLERLKKQDDLLEKRGNKFLRLGFEALDAEASHAGEHSQGVPTQGAPDSAVPGFDWAAFNASLEVDPVLLALVGQGADGGTNPQPSRQSPSVS